jgi:hypothetical protein
MGPHDLMVGLALLVILACAIGFKESPCDNYECRRVHAAHREQDKREQARKDHDRYHGLDGYEAPTCEFCRGRPLP